MKRIIASFVATVAIATCALGQQHPNQKKGFNPNDVYHFNALDTINAFSGNLTIAIPLGSTYSLGGGLSYGFTLYSNANLWEGQAHCHSELAAPVTPPALPPCTTVCPRFDSNCTSLNRVLRNFMYPHRRANAGLGWTLSLGRLYDEDDPVLGDRNVWTYESPDGADHVFESGEGVQVTTDGSYLRMSDFPDPQNPSTCATAYDVRKQAYVCLRQIEFPDGTKQIFQPPDAFNSHWALRTITNAFPANFLKIEYSEVSGNPRWTLRDTEGRTHIIDFERYNYDGEDRPLVKKVQLSVWRSSGDVKADFVFEYSQKTLGRGEFQNDTVHGTSGNYATVAMLDRVILPDATKFELTYRIGSMLENNGVPASMTLPTGGMLAWEWGIYQKPAASAVNSEEYFRNSLGVVKRQLYGRLPGVGSRPLEGTWTYKPEAESITAPGESWPDCYHNPYDPSHQQYCHEYRTTITDPQQNKIVNYFSVATQNEDPWSELDYGLPFTKYTGDGTAAPDTKWLSTQVLSAADTALRSTFVRYEYGPPPLPPRTVARSVRFDDDGNRHFDTDWTDWDGYGHHRVVTTSGTVPGTPKRVTRTNYLPPTTGWFTGLYDRITVEENDDGQVQLAEFCFDRTTGFLKQKIARKDPDGHTPATSHDVLSTFTPDARGNVEFERYYGGDLLPGERPVPGSGSRANASASGAVCASPAGFRTYELKHTRTEPTETTDGTVQSQYTGDAALVADLTIDRRSGLVSSSRDTAGVQTSYEYDWAGRFVAEKPTGRASTLYTYPGPTTDEITVTKTSTSSPATLLLPWAKYQVDGLGRVIRETTSLPGNAESVKNTVYNASGLRVSVSEPGSPAALTTFEYDPLGRVTKVTAPDAAATSFAYIGDRQKTRTSKIWTGANTQVSVVETYDGYGRLTMVDERSGPTTAASPSGSSVKTSYKYDLQDRLVEVKMGEASGGPVQLRRFDYDGRGFLRWESQPESGITSYLYDARGHVVTKLQGGANSKFDLDYFYDESERLLRIESRNPLFGQASGEPEFRPMKEFEYGDANDADAGGILNRAKGKMLYASRYNYTNLRSINYETEFKIEDFYEYKDVAGRRTGRWTTAYEDGAEMKSFYTAMTFDDLDLPKTIKYPMCFMCGYSPSDADRHLMTRTYDRGRLTALSGFLSGVTYWPNGMRNVTLHANGVQDVQTVGTMPRPTALSFGTFAQCVQPAFLVQPSNAVRPTPPAAVNVSAQATGTEPLQYDWYANGSHLADTTATISVNPTVKTDYYVTVTNACGQAYSQTATVTVNNACVPPTTGVIRAVTQPDNTWILTPDPTTGSAAVYAWTRTSDEAYLGNGKTLAVGELAVTTTYKLTITEAGCGVATSTVTIPVRLPMTTTGLVATANANRTVVSLTWPAVTNATSYVVMRRSSDGSVVQRVAEHAWDNDDTVAVDKVYAYSVMAQGGPGEYSNYSNVDVATTYAFVSAVPGAAITPLPFNEMLRAVNAVRAVSALPAVTWTTVLSPNDPLVGTGSGIAARQVLACRMRMDEALQALGARVTQYTSPDPTGLIVTADVINEVWKRAE